MLGLAQVGAAHQHARVLAQQLDVVGVLLERGQDRGLGLRQPVLVLLGDAQQVQQGDIPGVVREAGARLLGGAVEALDADEGEAAQPVRLGRRRGLAVEVGERLEGLLRASDLDVAARGLELGAHPITAPAISASAIRPTTQATRPGPSKLSYGSSSSVWKW